MDNLVSAQPTPQAAKEYKVLLEQLLREMVQLHEQMLPDRAAINQLKTETNALKAETRALLSGIGAQI